MSCCGDDGVGGWEAPLEKKKIFIQFAKKYVMINRVKGLGEI